MVIVKIRAGLGNQMFQYATARSLAARLGKKLALDLSFYEINKSRCFELDCFKIKASLLTQKQRQWETKKLSLRGTFAGMMLRNLPRGKIHEPFAENCRENFSEGVMRITGDTWLEGFWQNECYFSEIRETLLDEFTFKEAPDALNLEMLSHIGSVNSVCVHVRRGDYVNTPEASERLGACEPDYYLRAFDYIQNKVEDPAFFVFSDEPEWAAANFSHVKRMRIMSHNTGKNDHEDLRLMMHCRHFITANSSFSWWGAWLARFPGKLVVTPEIWFRAPAYRHRHAAPDSWVRL